MEGQAEESEREKVELLGRLRQSIAQEQKHLALMRKQEQELAKKHAEVEAQVEHLKRTSHASASDIHHLRDRYSYHVDRMQAEYRQHSERLAESREDSHRRIKNLEEEASDLGAGVAKDLAKAQYYRGQDQIADDSIETMERRRMIARKKEELARMDLDKARLATLSQQVREAEAVAKEKVAMMIDESHSRAIRQVSTAHGEMFNAQKVLMTETALAKSAVAEALEAKQGVAREQEQQDELRAKLSAVRQEYRKVVAETQHYKSKAVMAEDHARLLTRRSEKSREDLTDLKAEERDKWESAEQAIHEVETAEGNEAVAKTKGAVEHRLSQAEVEHAQELREQAEQELEHSQHRLYAAEGAARDMTHRKERTMVEAENSIGMAKRGDADLEVAAEKRHTSRQMAREMRASAKRKEKQAEGMMHSLGALAALARQAARVADASRARAEKAAGINPTCGDGPCP